MNHFIALALVLASIALSGCATARHGTTQQLSVRLTGDAQAASAVEIAEGAAPNGVLCELSNKLGRWEVTAPGQVTVARSISPLTVRCDSPQWVMHEPVIALADEHLIRSAGKGAGAGAGVGAVAGAAAPIVMLGVAMLPLSILFGAVAGSIYGGVAGPVVDGASGAAFNYPDEIVVVMRPRDKPPAMPVAISMPLAPNQ